jgi:hypothetical protein
MPSFNPRLQCEPQAEHVAVALNRGARASRKWQLSACCTSENKLFRIRFRFANDSEGGQLRIDVVNRFGTAVPVTINYEKSPILAVL